MNKKGSAMLLALVLTMAVLPAAGALAYIAQSDLAAALDDYHRTKAAYAAQGAVALIEADLLSGGDGQIIWLEIDTALTVDVNENEESWHITITAHCNRAKAEMEADIPMPEDEDDTSILNP